MARVVRCAAAMRKLRNLGAALAAFILIAAGTERISRQARPAGGARAEPAARSGGGSPTQPVATVGPRRSPRAPAVSEVESGGDPPARPLGNHDRTRVGGDGLVAANADALRAELAAIVGDCRIEHPSTEPLKLTLSASGTYVDGVLAVARLEAEHGLDPFGAVMACVLERASVVRLEAPVGQENAWELLELELSSST